jgi:hypothetical protein
VSPSDDLRRFASLMEDLFAGQPAPKRLMQVRPLLRLDAGESVDQVAPGSGYTRKRLVVWYQAIQAEGLAHWLGKKRVPDSERLARARSGIAQMLLGTLAERHFEDVSTGRLRADGYRIEDERVGRTDTDYRLLDPDDRPICRLNIKFHGTLFRQAAEYVSLPPEDCFALATYKIHGALQRQQQERLPFVFLIISVPDSPRELIERNVSNDWAWLAAMSGRLEEERIAARLAAEPWADVVKERIRASAFRVISARRAYGLLREQLFERVHALRLRGFNQLFRGAEINMHLSLSAEMIEYSQLLDLISERGPLEVAVRLDRGEI